MQCPCFPCFVTAGTRLSWQKRSDMASAVRTREVEMTLSLTVNTSDLRAWETDSCVLVWSQLTDTALHGLKDIWNTGNDPVIGNIRKGFLLLELCRGSQPACFLTLGKNLLAFTWQKDTPEQSFPAPPRRGSPLIVLIKSPRGLPHSYPECFSLSLPELAAHYLFLQHSCMGSWTNCGAGQLLAKG